MGAGGRRDRGRGWEGKEELGRGGGLESGSGAKNGSGWPEGEVEGRAGQRW